MTQIEFLDDLGRELDAASGRLIRAPRRSRGRGLLVPAAALAFVAAVAVAVWPSPPADPEREVSSPGGHAAVLGLLEVARRPHDDSDTTGPAREGAQALAAHGDEKLRILRTTQQREGIVLAAPAGPGACLFYPDPLEPGGAVTCWPAKEITAGRAVAALGHIQYGLAPDGVSAVELQWQGDKRAEVPVKNNLFTGNIRQGSGPLLSVDFRHEHGPATTGVVTPVAPAEIEQAVALARGQTTGVPLPPGKHDLTGLAPDQRQEKAHCLWQRHWVAAYEARDVQVQRQVAEVLAAAVGWPALRDEAPVRKVAEAARAHEAMLVSQNVARRC